MADMTLHAAGAHEEHSEAAQNENRKFAVWLYLTSEVVLFSILLAGYALFRAHDGIAVELVKLALNPWLVIANTFILLASSYAMVMGLRAIEMGSRSGFYRWIGLTTLMGTIFIGGQYIEYSELGHLEVSLDKQNFTVATTLFETVNHVEASFDGQLWQYSPDTEAYAAGNAARYAFEDLREFHVYDSVAAIPSTLSYASVVVPANADLSLIENPQSRNLLIYVGTFANYHVDFVNESAVLAGVNLAERKIEYNANYLLLDADGNVLSDESAIRDELVTLNSGVRNQDVPLERLALETANGEVVPFSAIVQGQAVDLNPQQYTTLNSFFSAFIGDSASNFGMRFYAPTAFHGAHVVVGVFWALMILWRGYRGFYDKNAIGVEMFGLYWHFVDVVWIVLFTLIYLI